MNSSQALQNFQWLAAAYPYNLLRFFGENDLYLGETLPDRMRTAADSLRRYSDLIPRITHPQENWRLAVRRFHRAVFQGTPAADYPQPISALVQNWDYSREVLDPYFNTLAEVMIQGAAWVSGLSDQAKYWVHRLAEAREAIQPWDRVKNLTNVALKFAQGGGTELALKILQEAVSVAAEIRGAEDYADSVGAVLQGLIQAGLGQHVPETFRRVLHQSKGLSDEERSTVYANLSSWLVRAGLGQSSIPLIRALIAEALDIKGGVDVRRAFEAIAEAGVELGETGPVLYNDLLAAIPKIGNERARADVIEYTARELAKLPRGTPTDRYFSDLSRMAAAIMDPRARDGALQAVCRWQKR